MNDADLGDNIDEYGRDVDGQHSKEDAEHQSVMGEDPVAHLDPRLVALPSPPFRPSVSLSALNLTCDHIVGGGSRVRRFP